MSQACSASSAGEIRLFLCAWSAFRSAVVKLPEEPSPVPPGMSAIDVSSMCGSVTPVSFKASRTIGCSIWSTDVTRSSFEYFTMISSWKVVCLVMYTYLSMAAATRKPPCSL